MQTPVQASTLPMTPHHRTLAPTAVMSKSLATALVVALLVFVLGPLVVLILWAFAGEWYYPALLPQQFSLSWWSTVLSDSHFGHSVLLSFTFAPIVTILSAFLCLPAAYAFSRYQFPGRRAMFIGIFATNAFPKMGLYIAIAGILYAVHLMDTFWGVIVIQMINTIVVMTWIPAAAFSSVPKSLEEAARDVGAGPFRTFWYVTLPMARPGIIVALIQAFLASFDEAQGTFLVGAPNYVTMPVQMYSMVTNYPQQAAAVYSILLSIPSFILLLLIRKYIVGGYLAAGFRMK